MIYYVKAAQYRSRAGVQDVPKYTLMDNHSNVCVRMLTIACKARGLSSSRPAIPVQCSYGACAQEALRPNQATKAHSAKPSYREPHPDSS